MALKRAHSLSTDIPDLSNYSDYELDEPAKKIHAEETTHQKATKTGATTKASPAYPSSATPSAPASGTSVSSSSPLCARTGLVKLAVQLGAQAKSKPTSIASCLAAPPVLATRKDTPPVHFAKRGSAELAISATSTPAAKASAIDAYRKDLYSATAPSSRSSAWATWCRFHAHWFGFGVLVLPLTATKVEGVLAVFKAGRYRTPGNYVSVARTHHVREGPPIDEALKWELNAGARSVTRGIGPSHQCAELPVPRFVELDFADYPTNDKDPIGAWIS